MAFDQDAGARCVRGFCSGPWSSSASKPCSGRGDSPAADRDIELVDDAGGFDLRAIVELDRVRRMRVLDERQVVASVESAVRGGPNAPVGRGPGERDVSRAQLPELVLEARLLECRVEPLVDERLAWRLHELRHPFPLGAPVAQVVVRVLHPYDGDARGTRPLDSARDVPDDPGGVPRLAHHAALHVDDHQDCLVARTHRCHSLFLRIDDECFVAAAL
jgi:hypothetical protein